MKPLHIFLTAAAVCVLSILSLVWVTHRTAAAHEAQVAANRKLEREEQRALEVLQRRDVEAKEYTERAKANLENWKRAFMDDDKELVCFHGHIFNAKVMRYEISCDIGWKGYVPSLKVMCNQDRCVHEKYEALPQSPHQPLQSLESRMREQTRMDRAQVFKDDGD